MRGLRCGGVCPPAQQSLRNQLATGSGKAIPVTYPRPNPVSLYFIPEGLFQGE